MNGWLEDGYGVIGWRIGRRSGIVQHGHGHEGHTVPVCGRTPDSQ